MRNICTEFNLKKISTFYHGYLRQYYYKILIICTTRRAKFDNIKVCSLIRSLNLVISRFIILSTVLQAEACKLNTIIVIIYLQLYPLISKVHKCHLTSICYTIREIHEN